VRVHPTTPVVGADPKAFETALTGRRAGESFEIPVELPAEFEARAAAGKTGLARVTLREVYRLVAPSDEDLLRELDLPDLGALRGDVRRRIEQSKVEAERRRAEDEILDRAAAENPFEIPERLVERQLEARLSQARAHYEARGVQAEQVQAEVDRERSRSRDDLLKGIRRFFLMDAIARKEKLFVTEDDLDAELRRIAERNQASPDEVRRYYEQQDLVSALKMDVLESKVRAFLFENAKRNEV